MFLDKTIESLVNKHIKEDVKVDYFLTLTKSILKDYLICMYLKEEDLEERINSLKNKSFQDFMKEISFIRFENGTYKRKGFSGFSKENLKLLERAYGQDLYKRVINNLKK